VQRTFCATVNPKSLAPFATDAIAQRRLNHAKRDLFKRYLTHPSTDGTAKKSLAQIKLGFVATVEGIARRQDLVD
jgi:hypothetical protein